MKTKELLTQWYGNVSPMDDTRNNTEKMEELMSYSSASRRTRGNTNRRAEGDF